jgi:hypothetical protein
MITDIMVLFVTDMCVLVVYYECVMCVAIIVACQLNMKFCLIPSQIQSEKLENYCVCCCCVCVCVCVCLTCVVCDVCRVCLCVCSASSKLNIDLQEVPPRVNEILFCATASYCVNRLLFATSFGQCTQKRLICKKCCIFQCVCVCVCVCVTCWWILLCSNWNCHHGNISNVCICLCWWMLWSTGRLTWTVIKISVTCVFVYADGMFSGRKL